MKIITNLQATQADLTNTFVDVEKDTENFEQLTYRQFKHISTGYIVTFYFNHKTKQVSEMIADTDTEQIISTVA